MLKPESKTALQELGKTYHGRVLKEFLDEEILLLQNLETIESYDDALGKRNAIRVLKKLFSFLEERKQVNRDPSTYT